MFGGMIKNNPALAASSSHIISGGWNYLLLAGLVVVALIVGFLFRRNRVILVIVSSYFAKVVLDVIPWKYFNYFNKSFSPSPDIKIFLFVALLISFFFFLPGTALGVLFRTRIIRSISWWQSIILSFFMIILLMVVIISFLPLSTINQFSPFLADYFYQEPWRFAWFIAPIISLFILGK